MTLMSTPSLDTSLDFIWHLWQGAICGPKISITYLDEIVSFMSACLL